MKEVVLDRPSSTTAPARGYSSEVLLSRANVWTAGHGYPNITPATLRELVKEGILVGPRRRGRGRGQGAAWDWSARDYRRLLRVIRLMARGIRRRDQQRVALFILGEQLTPSVVRQDLLRFQRASTDRMHRELRSDFWRPGKVPAAIQQLAKKILDVGAPDAFLARLGPEGQQAAAHAVQDLVANPGVNQLLTLALDSWLRGPTGAASRGGLQQAVALVPADMQEFAAELAEFALMGAGLLAPTSRTASWAMPSSRLSPSSTTRTWSRSVTSCWDGTTSVEGCWSCSAACP